MEEGGVGVTLTTILAVFGACVLIRFVIGFLYRVVVWRAVLWLLSDDK